MLVKLMQQHHVGVYLWFLHKSWNIECYGNIMAWQRFDSKLYACTQPKDWTS